MATILILNGPNLNLLGVREPETYGSKTLADLQAFCADSAAQWGLRSIFHQSNHEGFLLDRLHEARLSTGDEPCVGVVINAGALTHTSIALHDAIKGVRPLPVIEVHLSNVFARESFREHSWIAPAALGSICGFGFEGYRLAISVLAGQHKRPAS